MGSVWACVGVVWVSVVGWFLCVCGSRSLSRSVALYLHRSLSLSLALELAGSLALRVGLGLA